MLIWVMMRTARSVLQRRGLSVEACPPAIYRGARYIKTTDGGVNAEVKRIGYNRLTETSDL